MRIYILSSLLISTIVLAIVNYIYYPNTTSLYDDYVQHLRGNLFAGILSAGSFLLSLKTFIIVKLQENVYSSEIYTQRFAKLKIIDKDLKLYKPLRDLSHFLFICILFCLTASSIQVTLGFISNYVTTLICIFISTFAGSLVFFSLLIIKKILDDWMDCLEEQDENRAQQGTSTSSPSAPLPPELAATSTTQQY